MLCIACIAIYNICACIDQPACSPDVFSDENIYLLGKRRVRQQQPWSVRQLKSKNDEQFLTIVLFFAQSQV